MAKDFYNHEPIFILSAYPRREHTCPCWELEISIFCVMGLLDVKTFELAGESLSVMNLGTATWTENSVMVFDVVLR